MYPNFTALTQTQAVLQTSKHHVCLTKSNTVKREEWSQHPEITNECIYKLEKTHVLHYLNIMEWYGMLGLKEVVTDIDTKIAHIAKFM